MGAYPALAPPLDRVCEAWARTPPRLRLVLAAVAVLGFGGWTQARLDAAETRWGGAPVEVLVAAEDLPVGAREPALERRALPPAAVPPGAVLELPDDAVLALALPRGHVLAGTHLDVRGAAAGLAEGDRAVPVPVEEGWGVEAGGFVDVWVTAGPSDEAARLLARSSPVLAIDPEQGPTALIGLAVDEVAALTEALSLGQVLLTHAPPP